MGKLVSKKYRRKPAKKRGRSKGFFGGLFKSSRRSKKLFGWF